MRHRLSGLSTYGLNGQCAGDEHPTYAPLEHGPLYPLYLESIDVDEKPLGATYSETIILL